jgi:hypothetical protein
MTADNSSDLAWKLWQFHHLERAEAVKLCGPTEAEGGALVSPGVDIFTRYVAGCFISAMGAAGIVGNLLAFLTIVTMKRRSLFHNLLLTLAIFDVVFLINGGIFFVWSSFKFKSNLYNLLFPKVIYPLGGISMTGKNLCFPTTTQEFV